jgi:hypothetical protein
MENPTVESVFGPYPYVTDPKPGGSTGPGPNHVTYDYDPIFFATPGTAAIVAKAVGGKVTAMNAITPFGPFMQNQPNLMVQMPDDSLHVAGLIANCFSHGYPWSYVNQMIAQEIGVPGFEWPQ